MNHCFKKLFLTLAGILVASSAMAQTTPRFLVSWKAQNYVPGFYLGKILPSKDSLVTIGFDLVNNNRMIDISKYSVVWYIDGKNIDSGIGKKSISVINPGTQPTIRIEVSGYSEDDLIHSFALPTVKPETVIDTKNPTGTTSLGENNLEALPYFFNGNSIGDFSIRWEVNNAIVGGIPENPELLSLNLESEASPIQTTINISAFIQNLKNQFEFATKRASLIIQ